MFSENNRTVKNIPEMKYIVEKPPTGNRVQQFLEIFAAVLKNSNYRIALEDYIKGVCKVFQVCNKLPCLSNDQRPEGYTLLPLRAIAQHIQKVFLIRG